MHCAIFGDIVGSRVISARSRVERSVLQERLEGLLEKISDRFSSSVFASFKADFEEVRAEAAIYRGDGFQGFFRRVDICLDIIETMIIEMYPYRIRFGVGIGDIDTKNTGNTMKLDGTAGSYARDAVATAKKTEEDAGLSRRTEPDLHSLPQPADSYLPPLFSFAFKTGRGDDALLNSLCMSVNRVAGKWTKRQWETVKALRESGGNRTKTAELLETNKSTVSRNLEAAEYKEYKRLFDTLKAYLSDTYDSVEKFEFIRLKEADTARQAAKRYLDFNVDYDRALAKYKEAVEIYSECGKEVEKAQTLDDIGRVYLKKGTAKEALDSFLEALEVRKKLEINEGIAISYINLGSAYSKLAQYVKSKEFFEKALEGSLLGDEDTASAYSGIASVYSDQGKYPEALEWCNKALVIREKVLGKDHPDTASTYNNIALVYSDQGKYSEALEWHNKDLAISEKVLGKDHPDTATTYNNIASVYYSQGKYPEALEWYNKALVIREKIFGTNHPKTTSAYYRLACVYERLDEEEKARELFKKAGL